jgi:hypothetical protein
MRSGKILFLTAVLLLSFGLFSEAHAQYYGRGNPYYYANPYGYGGNVVVIQQPRVPLFIERYGSNDALYTYDNVYGPEASAAGRMSRTVLNPQPQIFRIY